MSQHQERIIDSDGLRDQFLFSYKMDRMYINALGFVKKSSCFQLFLQILKVLFMTGTLIWFIHQHPIPGNSLFPPMLSAAGLSLILAIASITLISTTKNIAKNLIIAKDLDHIVEQPFDPNLRLNVFEDLISNTYNVRNPQNVQIDINSEKMLADIIKHYYLIINRDLNVLTRLCEILLFGISIWLCVLIAIKDVDTTLKVLIICYVSVEFLIQWKIVCIAIVIAISPLIFCVICCITICCRPKTKKDFIEKLNPIQYRESVQLQHGVECLICFTNFYPDEKICILECPAKHAFHQICIKTWFQVGSTCPVCRHDFANDENI